MKKLKFYWLAFRGNLRGLWGVWLTMAVITAFTFLFSAFFGRLILDSAASGWGPEAAVFGGLALAVSAYAVAHMLNLYALYLKKADKRIKIYRTVGADKSTVLVSMGAETFLVFAAGILIGLAADYALHSLIEMMEGHTYLTGKVFWFSLAWTLLVPVISFAVTAGRRVREIRPAKAVKP